MARSNIKICGITPEHHFPECHPHFFTQLCETDKVAITAQDPDIQEMVEVSVSIVARNFRIVSTPVGKKLLTHAIKNIELVWKSSGINYSSKFCIPFCVFVLLDDRDEIVTNVCFIIEDIDIFQINPRCVAVSTLILVMPDLRPKHNPWCDDNTIRCDIKLKGCGSPHKTSSPFANYMEDHTFSQLLNTPIN